MIGPVIDEVSTIRPRPEAIAARTTNFRRGGHEGLHAVDIALHVDVEHLGQLIGCHRPQRRLREDARVGAQHVDSTERVDDGFGHRGAGVPVGHVGLDADHPAAAQSIEMRDRGVEVGSGACGNRHLRTRGGEYRRDTKADSLAATGDQD